jgi:hypothetical protein
MQSFDLLGAQRDGRVTPAEADVGVMAFGLGELTDFLNKGERFPEIAESKRALDAVGIVSQLPIESLCLQAVGFITREWRDAAAARRACFLGKNFAHILLSKTIFWQQRRQDERLSIDLPEHDVERADDRRDIGKHVPATQEVHRL